VAELPSSSVEAGAARNGKAKRRPWRPCLAIGRRTGKKKSEQKGNLGFLAAAEDFL
jgi:hypothetical protein